VKAGGTEEVLPFDDLKAKIHREQPGSSCDISPARLLKSSCDLLEFNKLEKNNKHACSKHNAERCSEEHAT
jgi:hypothetical protein